MAQTQKRHRQSPGGYGATRKAGFRQNNPGPELSVGIVADDQVIGRRVAAALIRDGLEVISGATEPERLAAECADRRLHAVVVACDRGQCEAVIRFLRRRLPATRIVVVGRSMNPVSVRKALKTGADGFVFDSELEFTLGLAIRAVCAGQLSVPRELRQPITGAALSYREKQALGMVAAGFANREIASKLCLAESTVKSHLSSAFKKLGVRSRNAAAEMILDPEGGLGIAIQRITAHDSGSGGARDRNMSDLGSVQVEVSGRLASGQRKSGAPESDGQRSRSWRRRGKSR